MEAYIIVVGANLWNDCQGNSFCFVLNDGLIHMVTSNSSWQEAELHSNQQSSPTLSSVIIFNLTCIFSNVWYIYTCLFCCRVQRLEARKLPTFNVTNQTACKQQRFPLRGLQALSLSSQTLCQTGLQWWQNGVHVMWKAGASYTKTEE